MQDTRSTAVALAAALTIGIVSIAAVHAQQPPRPAPPATGAPPAQGGGNATAPAPAQGAANATPAAPAAPPARPIVPASASSIGAKPDAYYGQLVTIYATVEE